MCLTRVTINNLITWKWHILLVCTHRGFPSWHKNSFQCKLQLSGITEDSLLFKTVITFPVCHYANTLCSCLKSLVAELLVSATSAMQNITSVECKSLNTNWSQRLCGCYLLDALPNAMLPVFPVLGMEKKKRTRSKLDVFFNSTRISKTVTVHLKRFIHYLMCFFQFFLIWIQMVGAACSQPELCDWDDHTRISSHWHHTEPRASKCMKPSWNLSFRLIG